MMEKNCWGRSSNFELVTCFCWRICFDFVIVWVGCWGIFICSFWFQGHNCLGGQTIFASCFVPLWIGGSGFWASFSGCQEGSPVVGGPFWSSASLSRLVWHCGLWGFCQCVCFVIIRQLSSSGELLQKWTGGDLQIFSPSSKKLLFKVLFPFFSL